MPEENKQKFHKKKLAGTLSDDRPMPYDPEAEAAILGAIIIEPIPLLEQAIEMLGTAAFYFDNTKKEKPKQVFHNPRHQRIYASLCELHHEQTSIDLITLSHALDKANALEYIGGDAYLAELTSSIVTTANFETWCKIVRDFAILRSMISTCETIKDKCYANESPVSDLLDQLEKEVLEAGQMEQREETLHIHTVIKESEDSAFKYLMNLRNKDSTAVGIPTGYPDLDRKITGLKPGEMFVLAARPSIGKTSFALNLMSQIALREGPMKTPVGFFSLEMTARQLAVRLLCTESGYSERDFIDGAISSMSKVTNAASRIAASPIYIDPTPALKIRELRSKARRMHSMYNIQIIFIDYLQLMKAEIRSDNRQEEVATISSGIKALAKELNIPIVVLAQLNREVEKSATGVPKLSHLRESGSIEQDADIVAFLHRDRDAQKEQDAAYISKGLDAKLIIEKNRNGQIGEIPLLFFPKLTLFRSASRVKDEDVP